MPEVALEFVRSLGTFPFAAIDNSLVENAIEISVRHQLSYWDAAIIAAGTRLGAKTLYTEDLNHEQFYGPIRAINPFTRPAE